MSLLALGINHNTASVALRERVAFGPDRIDRALRELVEQPGVSEAVIVSTCNRTEIYALAEDDGTSLQDWLATQRSTEVAFDDHPEAFANFNTLAQLAAPN